MSLKGPTKYPKQWMKKSHIEGYDITIKVQNIGDHEWSKNFRKEKSGLVMMEIIKIVLDFSTATLDAGTQ